MTTSGSQKRLRFDRAELREAGPQECVVEVVFSFGDRTITSSAEGSSQGTGPLKAAAAAAIKALKDAVEDRFECRLADLDHVSALGKNLIAVLIDVDFENKQVQVFGSCQIGGSEIDAAVKATLNATNRFFELAMRG